MTAWRLALTALIALCLVPVAQAATIGAAVVIVNNVTGRIERAAAGMPLHVGIDVQQDETVETATSSAAKLIFEDNTQFEIGPASQVTLDRFVYDADPSKSQVALSVAKGAARFVTGYLPKTDYEIRTPVATIGIRGTIVDIEVAGNGTTKIYVEEGVAFVNGGGAVVELGPGQATIVFPHGVPSPPNRPNAPPNRLLRTLLQQAENTPAGSDALIRSVLRLHPEGGLRLIEITARLVEDDPALAPTVVALAHNATPAQQVALGAALGQVVAYFANRGDQADQQLITAAMATAPPLVLTTFANAVGPNNNSNVGFVPTIGNTNLTTSTCVSPSRPGNRC